MGGRKTLLQLAGKPLLLHTLDRFLPFRERICQTIIVAHPGDLRAIEEILGESAALAVVPGGARRQDSVWAGLARLVPEAELVAIHDAVRPFVAPEAIAAALAAAEETGAAIVAAPMKPTVKRVADGRIVATLDRRDLWCAQTPQVFRRQLIFEAFQAATRDRFEATDDAQLVERLGRPVAIVPGSDLNIKLTTPEDLAVAEAILARHLAPNAAAGSPPHVTATS